VIVCDGFIGNIALKISEGVAHHIVNLLKDALQSTLSSQVGYVLSRQATRAFERRLTTRNTGHRRGSRPCAFGTRDQPRVAAPPAGHLRGSPRDAALKEGIVLFAHARATRNGRGRFKE